MQNYFTPDIETASRDYLTAIQSARLIKMVENCYKHVPFISRSLMRSVFCPVILNQ